MKKCIAVITALMILIIVSFFAVWQIQEVVVSRITSPNGEYIAVVSYRRFQRPFASLPGQSSDHAGYLRIEDKSGKSYGKVTLPLIWMADDLRWEEQGACLIGAGTWDFHTGICEPWK